ncbi:MAG: aquaporin family protein [Halobacteriales archaeon]|nr:aquaporin family protein [Halobacteriales archaeon]
MDNSQKYVAELLGTALIVFVGTAAIVTTGGNVLVSALAFGLAWAGMWWVFGAVSGGHFNPAITLANVVTRRTATKDFVPYVVSQVIGGILGAAIVWFAFNGSPALATDAFATSLAAPTLGVWTMTSIVVLETITTLVLCLVYLGITERTNAPGITGLALGFAYTGTIVATLGVTWSGLNPVRTLGPIALAHASIGTMLTFWIAPIVGAVIAAGLWMSVVQPTKTSAPSSFTTEA